jgi:hypothetical protein
MPTKGSWTSRLYSAVKSGKIGQCRELTSRQRLTGGGGGAAAKAERDVEIIKLKDEGNYFETPAASVVKQS